MLEVHHHCNNDPNNVSNIVAIEKWPKDVTNMHQGQNYNDKIVGTIARSKWNAIGATSHPFQ